MCSSVVGSLRFGNFLGFLKVLNLLVCFKPFSDGLGPELEETPQWVNGLFLGRSGHRQTLLMWKQKSRVSRKRNTAETELRL